MNDVLKEEFKRIIEKGKALYENTPPFVIFDKKYKVSGKKLPVYVLKDSKILRPKFNPFYCFFKLNIVDFASLFQAYAQGAKDAFRDFILEFFESNIKEKVNVKPSALLVESHGKERLKKDNAFFLKEVVLPKQKKWRVGVYLNSDPVFFFNWAVQEESGLRLFYFGKNNFGLGKLSDQKLGELTIASLGLWNSEYKVKEYIPGIPFV